MFPLPFDAKPSDGLLELPARDVVDGLALAQAALDARPTVKSGLQELLNEPVDPKLDEFLDALLSLKDAFLDLWVTEAAHQMIQGNDARTAAAVATLDRQERPPQPARHGDTASGLDICPAGGLDHATRPR